MCCRGTLLPDPRYDALRCIVMAAADDAEDMSDGNYTARVLLFHEKTTKLREGLPNVQVHCVLPAGYLDPCYQASCSIASLTACSALASSERRCCRHPEAGVMALPDAC